MSIQENTSASASPNHQFVYLDGLRGVAAIAVAAHHGKEFFGAPIHSGYLSVDFFFVLSGFVLSYAYKKALENGLSVIEFIKARIIRLYPLYALSSFIGFLYCIFLSDYAWINLLITSVLGIIVVPTPNIFGVLNKYPFPLDHPAWSLFFEFIASAGFAIYIVSYHAKNLYKVIAVFVIIFVSSVAYYGSADFGWWFRSLPFGLARVALSFLVGMAIYLLFERTKYNNRMQSQLIPAVLLCAFLSVDVGEYHRIIYDSVVVVIAFPILIYFSAFVNPGIYSREFYRVLGDISYPLYVLHVPTYLWAAWAIPKFGWDTRDISSAMLVGSALLTLSYITAIWFDLPVRSWLKRRFSRRSSARRPTVETIELG